MLHRLKKIIEAFFTRIAIRCNKSTVSDITPNCDDVKIPVDKKVKTRDSLHFYKVACLNRTKSISFIESQKTNDIKTYFNEESLKKVKFELESNFNY